MDRLSSHFAFWRALGLSVRAANILVNLSCQSLSDVRRFGRDGLLSAFGMGPPTFNEIARLVGWPLVPALARPRRPRTPMDITRRMARDAMVKEPVVKKPVVKKPIEIVLEPEPDRTSLQFSFVCSEWQLDCGDGVKMKIENGVIFFKPVSAGSAADVFELYLDPDENVWKTEMLAYYPMIGRLFRQLQWFGWSIHQPFFELHAAQRGWYSISSKPRRHLPTEMPYVQVTPIVIYDGTHAEMADHLPRVFQVLKGKPFE